MSSRAEPFGMILMKASSQNRRTTAYHREMASTPFAAKRANNLLAGADLPSLDAQSPEPAIRLPHSPRWSELRVYGEFLTMQPLLSVQAFHAVLLNLQFLNHIQRTATTFSGAPIGQENLSRGSPSRYSRTEGVIRPGAVQPDRRDHKRGLCLGNRTKSTP